MRVRLALLLGALVVVAGGCRTTVVVAVQVDEDGGGRVEAAVGLDEAAAARVGDLAGELRVDDLRQAGWEVVGPRVEGDGRTWVRARHSFSRPEDATPLLAQVGVPFADLHVAQERSFLRTETSLRGSVDLSAGLDAFGDAALRERLGGHLLGVSQVELERQIGAPLSEAVEVRVVARLPGDIDVDADSAEVTGGTAVLPAAFGERVVVRAEAEAWNGDRIALASGAALAGVALVVVLVQRALAGRRSPEGVAPGR